MSLWIGFFSRNVFSDVFTGKNSVTWCVYDQRLVRINQLNPCRKVGDNLGLLLQSVRKIRRLQYIGAGLQSDWVTW